MSKQYNELKEVATKIADACEENFGYAPDYPWFDKLLSQMSDLENQLKEEQKDEWIEWLDLREEYLK